MKDFMKRVKADYILTSLLCAALGVVFVVWKEGVIDVIGTVLSVAMILVGIIYLGSFILSLATFGASTIAGIIILAVGILFLIQPQLIVSLIPIIIGVGLVFHGIRAVTESINAKKYGFSKWGVDLAFAIICLLCGLVCVFCPLEVMEQFIVLIGVILIINGVMNLVICMTATHATRSYNKQKETVDSGFVEDEEGNTDADDGI